MGFAAVFVRTAPAEPSVAAGAFNFTSNEYVPAGNSYTLSRLARTFLLRGNGTPATLNAAASAAGNRNCPFALGGTVTCQLACAPETVHSEAIRPYADSYAKSTLPR